MNTLYKQLVTPLTVLWHNRFLKPFLLLLMSAAFFGCSTVQSVSILGSEPYQLDEKNWDGTWVAEDGSFKLKVTNGKNGEAEVLFIDSGELQKYSLFFTKTGKDSFVNVLLNEKEKFKHPGARTVYYPVKFKRNNNQLILWIIDVKKIQNAVEAKQIKGVTKKDKYSSDVLLTGDRASLNAFFTNNRDKMLYVYEEPFIVRKLTK